MIVNGHLNDAQYRQAKKLLTSLDLPPAKRRRLMLRLAKHGVIAAAKRHIRAQTDPDGKAWPKRQSAWRAKMLRQMAKRMHVRVLGSDAVRIYLQGGNYRSGTRSLPAGRVGAWQQGGMQATVKATDMVRTGSRSPATRRQASALRDKGFTVKRGNRRVTPSATYITQTLSKAGAGIRIRMLEDIDTYGSTKAAPAPKRSWKIDIPARAFLGMNDNEFDAALARVLQSLNYGQDLPDQRG